MACVLLSLHGHECRAKAQCSSGCGKLQPKVGRSSVIIQAMDKLRAIQYFVAAAEGASLSAAARQHDVSAAAVAKLIGALEAKLNVRLLERRAQGVVLTAAMSRELLNT
jgi:hypothetical protein